MKSIDRAFQSASLQLASPDAQSNDDFAITNVSRGLSRGVSRRRFMQASGGLVLGLHLGSLMAATGTQGTTAAFEPNAFVQIGNDGSITILAKHLEMGQGIYTGLASLIAEELDADWSKVHVEGAPADVKLYQNLGWGIQGTGGSSSIANSYEQMRKAGATARAMLVSAAAAKWKVAPASITVSKSVVHHAASGRKAGFGELAAAAATQPVPTDVKLKAPKEFKLVGNAKLPRLDSFAKTNGTAMFTQDIKLPGMLVAVPLHPVRFGATVKSVNATKAKAIPGVVEVVQFAGTARSFAGVAVLATNTWAARQGRDALEVEWDETHAYKKGSPEILTQYRAALEKPGLVARKVGDVDAALVKPATLIEADYAVPFLAHAAMEPLNCLVQLGESTCEIWNGEQFQTIDQGSVAKFLNMPADKIKINQLYAGGSFGRRANPHSDYVVEAVSIAKSARAQGVKGPVKMVWMREDDTRGGYYRPINVHRARLALDAQGRLSAWHVRMAGQSIMEGSAFAGVIKDGIDPTSVEGQADLPYDVPNLQVELYTPTDVGVPIQWFRSVGHTHSAFSSEGLMDEAAVAAGKDPLAFRLAMLAKHPRHSGVLQLAARQAGWSKPLAPGAKGERRGRGLAVHESFNTFVAQVAEITVKADGTFKVDRIICAVDCGVAVNPDVIKAQIEGGIGFGLAAALHGAITLKDGVVEQSNFHNYQVLRINEMPKIEVFIVGSTEKPSGVGEPGVPPVAPAVVNAIFNAMGKRLRTLPIADQLTKA